MHSQGQTTIELLIILAASLVALGIIYYLYSEQVYFSVEAQELATAKSTIERMVNAANSVYISGAGSKARVLINIDSSFDMDNSNIVGRSILIRLSDGTDIAGSADVNLSGSWKKFDDQYVLDGYYATLVFDGNIVNIYYDDFELSNESIYVSALQGTTISKYFSVRNLSVDTAYFLVSNNFSHNPFAELSIDPSDVYFSLTNNESRVIDFNIILDDSSSGNYAGSIEIIGEISDGVSDSNFTKYVNVSVESFLEMNDLLIYPKTTSFTTIPDSNVTKSFSVCNSSSTDISGISWSRDSNVDANMLSWFSFNPADSEGVVITEVAGGVCKDFDLTFVVPLGATPKIYDSNFTATYNDGNAFTAYIYATIVAP
ncbi:MAG: hypothetical protein WC462_03980 [archaeon]